MNKEELTPLQALNKIGEKWTVCWNNGLGHSNQIKELDDYKIIEKSLKALEIIKNKKVNVRALLKSYYSPKDGLAVYNSQCCDWQEMESKELTQEEYELLREVLL